MSSSKEEMTEEQKRRKRINRYKKIIVGIILTLILLPTVLCIVLFIKVNKMSNELNEIKTAMKQNIESVDEKQAIEEPTSEVESKPSTNANINETVGRTEEETTKEEMTTELETTTAEKSQKELVEEALAEGRKVVYLTYDDGPSKNTGKLLEVLDKYGVKVTFFVIRTPAHEEYVKQIVEEGHTLAMHTMTHDYANVYKSQANFKEEVDGIRNYLDKLTGVRPFVFRFPGGSSNSQTAIPIKNFIKYLDDQGIVYYDWNVSSGDGGSGLLTPEQVYNNVMNGIARNDVSVVLLHDSEYKPTTLEATPKIIEKLQEMNALILPITADTIPIHHNV